MGAGAALVDGFFFCAATAGNLVPLSRPSLHGVVRERDIPYRGTGLREHRLDVYRPRRPRGPLPVVVYVHGGAFRALSKDTHWLFGLAFARRGYLVFNLSYRLAPRHPFPAAIADVCAGYEWVLRNAHRFGGDPSRVAVAGESAGANLVTALTVAACYPREEPFARLVYDAGVVPKAVIPACGMLQVSDPERFARRRRIGTFLDDRMNEVADHYFRGLDRNPPDSVDLADPLLVLERAEAPGRPLPPFFVGVGTRDVLLDDTRRLKGALDRLNVPCEASYYRGELHAFHVLVVTPNARRYWRESFRFLDRHLPAAAPGG